MTTNQLSQHRRRRACPSGDQTSFFSTRQIPRHQEVEDEMFDRSGNTRREQRCRIRFRTSEPVLSVQCCSHGLCGHQKIQHSAKRRSISWINQSKNQSINQSINHSINQSTTQSIDQSINCRLRCQTAYCDVTETTWGKSSFLKYSTIVLLFMTPELLTPIKTSPEVPSNLERICIFPSYKTTGRRVRPEAKPPNKVVMCFLSEPVPNDPTSRVSHSAYTLSWVSSVGNGNSSKLTILSGSVKKPSSCSVVNSMIQASHFSRFHSSDFFRLLADVARTLNRLCRPRKSRCHCGENLVWLKPRLRRKDMTNRSIAWSINRSIKQSVNQWNSTMTISRSNKSINQQTSCFLDWTYLCKQRFERPASITTACWEGFQFSSIVTRCPPGQFLPAHSTSVVCLSPTYFPAVGALVSLCLFHSSWPHPEWMRHSPAHPSERRP